MQRGEHIIHDQFLVQDDRILVVIPFPGHEPDEQVLSECDLAQIGRRTVRNDLALLNVFPVGNDRTLVDTGTLIGSSELQQGVLLQLVIVISANADLLGIHKLYCTGVLGQHDDTRVSGGFVFNAGTYVRRLGHKKRNRLTLHVGSHQRTVGVVVLQERDHRRRHRYYLLRRDVHQIHAIPREHGDLSADTSGSHLLVLEVAVLGQRLVGLRDDEELFLVGREILDLIGDSVVLLIYDPVRSLYETILVDHTIGGQRTDQANVWTFWSLDRAHSAVMRLMDISDFESGSLSGKSSRTQRRQSSLMGQFRQWIVGIHELRQLGTSEEFLDGSRHRTDVHQILRAGILIVLGRHPFSDHSLHSGKTDTDLILQKFSDCTESSVAQMVDIIHTADTIRQVEDITHRCNDVRHDDVLGRQFVSSDSACVLQRISLESLVQDLLQDRIENLVRETDVLGLKVYILTDVNELAADDSRHCVSIVLAVYIYMMDAGILDDLTHRSADPLATLHQDLSGVGIDDVLCGNDVYQSVRQTELLVVFESSHVCQIVSLALVEQSIQMGPGGIDAFRLTRPEFLVDFL